MAVTTTPGAGNLIGYPVLYSPTDLTNQTKATIADFHVDIKYKIARQVGMAYMGNDTQTPPQPIWEARYELVDRFVREATLNQDLMDYQQQIKKGNAYAPVSVPPPTLLAAKEGEGALSEEEELLIAQNVKELPRDEAMEHQQEDWLAPDPNSRTSYIFPEDVPASGRKGITEAEENKNIEKAKKEEAKQLGEQQKARAEALKGEARNGHKNGSKK